MSVPPLGERRLFRPVRDIPRNSQHGRISKIAERGIVATLSLRRNSDPSLTASHVIEIKFTLPSNFRGGGIASVPGFLAKESEVSRGKPLTGLAVKVTDGFFMFGLSAVDADRQRNLLLLKDQEWFDIPIYYGNGERAILAVQKKADGRPQLHRRLRGLGPIVATARQVKPGGVSSVRDRGLTAEARPPA